MKNRLIMQFAGILLAAIICWGEISLQLPYKQVTLAHSTSGPVFYGADFCGGEPGEPALPAHMVTLLLPPDADLSSLSVSVDNVQVELVDGSCDIQPAAPYATSLGPLEYGRGKTIINGRDISIYRADAFFPATYAQVASTGQLGAYKLITVKMLPFRYNPVTGQLKKLTSGTLRVNFRLDPGFRASPWGVSDWIYEAAREKALNFSQFAPAYPRDTRSAKPVLAIITNDALVSGSKVLSSFVDSKKNRGFDVLVVTEKTWGGSNYDKADDIRAWLKNNYQSKNIKYALFIDDPTPVSGGASMRSAWAQATPLGTDCPTDHFFADLSGNWDLNGNSFVGEKDWDVGPGGADNYPEIYVGRFPVYDKDYTTLDKILQRTINYENAQPSSISWRKSALLMCEEYDALTPCYQSVEGVKKNAAEPCGWSTYRIYDKTGAVVNPDVTPTSISAATTAWKSKSFGVCVWIAHGNATEAGEFMTSTAAAQLNDQYPTFTYMASCLNAKAEQKDNLAYSMVKYNCIGSISATRLSIYQLGQTDPTIKQMTNLSMAYYMGLAFIKDTLPAGEALAKIKRDLNTQFKDIWINFCNYNLYGDPTVSVMSKGGQTKTIPAPTSNAKASWKILQSPQGIILSNSYLENATVTVSIYDLKGALVYATAQVFNHTPAILFWNKKDSYGNRPGSGLYCAKVSIHKSSGAVFSLQIPVVIY